MNEFGQGKHTRGCVNRETIVGRKVHGGGV
jgi:hypothetical protein